MINTKRIRKPRDFSPDARSKRFERFICALFTLYMCALYVVNEIAGYIAIAEALLIVFMVFAFMYIVNGRKLVIGPGIVFIAAFAAFCYLSAIWAFNAQAALAKAKTVTLILIACIFINSFFAVSGRIDSFVKAMLAAGLVLTVFLLIYYGPVEFIRRTIDGERLGEEIANQNSIGMYAAYTVVICFYYAILKNKKAFYFVSLLPMLTVAGSGSRKALLICVLGFLFMFLFKPRKGGDIRGILKLLIGLCAAALVLSLLMSLPIFGTVSSRMSSLLKIFTDSDSVDNSTYLRMLMIKGGWQYFLLHPFTGIGIGNSQYVAASIVGRETYLHNNFIELLASTGIFGFLIYYMPYAYVTGAFIKRLKKHEPLCILALCLVTISVFMDVAQVSYYSKFSYITLIFAFLALRDAKLKEKAASDASTAASEAEASASAGKDCAAENLGDAETASKSPV